jgi:cytoskeletal protein RodZ
MVRRTGLLIAGWALATVLALVLGLQAVSAISASVTSSPKAPLSPASVKAALDRSSSSDESSSSSSSDDQSSSSSSSAGDDQGGQPSQNSSDEGLTSSSDDASESSASNAAVPPEDRTYQLSGGSVGVRFENGEAHLLWATPNPGFSVESSGSASTVDVRFRNDSHESRLKAFWDNGPQSEIEEKD